jgi:predicted Zn finger-like uncharacterized protein
MIVVCTRCQAKFRVADEKVGPRGAKVRCSRCQNVFLVHRDLGSMPLEADAAAQAQPSRPPPDPVRPPAVELDLEPGGGSTRSPAVPPPPDPFGLGPASDFSAAPGDTGMLPPPEDPFLAATQGPPQPSPSPSAALDPFAAAMAAPRPTVDPFAAPAGNFAGPQPTTQVAAARPDPFAASPAFTPAPVETPAPSPSMSPLALPVTDLSDLMAGQEIPQPDGETSDPDFALEARPTAPRPRLSALEAAAEAAEAQAAAHSAERHEPEFYSEAGSVSIGLAGEPGGPSRVPATEARTPVQGTRAATPAPSLPRPRARRAAGAEAEAELAARTIAQKLPRLRRASRLRSIALNALALVVLVIVSLALLVLVRSGGKLEPGALRPSSVLRALGGRPLGTFAAVEVTSGAYDRAKGPPLLFVRGRAVSRSDHPVRALRVSVEVVRRGEVVARGQALAGAVLTPEELSGVADAGMLASLGRSAEGRVPAEVKPGDSVPFLVAIADYPGDLSAAALRVTVAEGAPGAGP